MILSPETLHRHPKQPYICSGVISSKSYWYCIHVSRILGCTRHTQYTTDKTVYNSHSISVSIWWQSTCRRMQPENLNTWVSLGVFNPFMQESIVSPQLFSTWTALDHWTNVVLFSFDFFTRQNRLLRKRDVTY